MHAHRTIAFDDLIAIAAFRYALGRRSYIVEHISEWLVEHKDILNPGDINLITNEIEQAIEQNLAGDDCDVRQWKWCADKLKERRK